MGTTRPAAGGAKRAAGDGSWAGAKAGELTATMEVDEGSGRAASTSKLGSSWCDGEGLGGGRQVQTRRGCFRRWFTAHPRWRARGAGEQGLWAVAVRAVS